ncbi:MAG: TadE/TadG family type IV pilus assembly protein [Actinomycetes bacterium]
MSPGSARGQATVELALALPVVLLALALVVQVGLVARDRVAVVHAARAAARTAVVTPQLGAATRAARSAGGALSTASVRLDGDPSPGGLLGVTVTVRPTRVPLVGQLVAGRQLRERLVVLVEGPDG